MMLVEIFEEKKVIKILMMTDSSTSPDEADRQLRAIFGDEAVDEADELNRQFEAYLAKKRLEETAPAESEPPKS